jgi:aminoglycoside phosphotransferase (APT) family kinase protein
MPHEIAPDDIVRTHEESAAGDRPPLLVLDPLLSFLDEQGLGDGEPEISPIGDGHSNATYLFERGGARFVLRRPPRPPLPPSAHDMVREARLQNAIRAAGFTRLAEIVAVCEDESVLGVPFYVMRFIDGHVVTGELPPGLESQEARRALGTDLVDTLVEIHAARGPSLDPFRREGSYLERQVRRFTQLWEINKTRTVPAVEEVAAYLTTNVPAPLEPTVVHGDYRLGNMMVVPDDPTRIAAVLDWEMGAIGDPRADVGYLLATYSEPNGRVSPLGSSPVTAEPGFPSRAELVQRYIEQSGRDVQPLPWFEALALWKAAVFCEAIYGRFIRGELGEEDTRAAIFEVAVPLLAETALEAVS